MKLKINRDHLLRGITLATRSVPTKSANPLFVNVLLEANEKGLTMLGSSGDLTIKTLIPIRVNELEVLRVYTEGKALVNAKLLNEIIRHLEGSEVDIEVIDQTLLQVSDGRSEFNLNSIKPSDYPDFDLEHDGVRFAIDRQHFVKLVDQTVFAASTKENRPILTAVHLNAKNGLLVAAATDTARLARKQVELKDNVTFFANVPAKTMQDIARIVEVTRVEEIEISVTDKKILFEFDGTFIASRLVGGDYPSTEEIVLKTYNSFLEANANELIKAMERVSLLSSERERIVRLTMSENLVQVSSSSPNAGRASEVVPTCRYSGEPLSIHFNVGYVTAAIRACGSDDIHIEFTGELKPFEVKNLEDDSQTQIITPTRTFVDK